MIIIIIKGRSKEFSVHPVVTLPKDVVISRQCLSIWISGIGGMVGIVFARCSSSVANKIQI